MRNGKLFSIIALIIIAVLAFVALYGLGPIKSVEDSMKLGLDIEGGVVVVYEAQTDAIGDDLAKIMSQTKSVLSKRVDQLGLTEPNISIQGENRIRIELPGVKDVQEAMDVIGQTAQLKFIRVYADSIAYPDMTINDFHGELILTGKNVSDAGISSDEYGNPAVSLKLDRTGSELFKDATIAVVNYEDKRGQIAILLDDIVISAPYTNMIIPGGEAIITGSFDFKYAQNLSTLIRGGALPVDLVEVQTGLMGPILGIDALKYSVYAAGIGLMLVIIFMIGFYRLPGVIAGLVLILYSSIVMFIMVGLNATLTLPGMAGLVLSIGMAVDAN
ncbi:MAG: protein translocase subunit SecD, partial [Clostridiales bacterium]|nr:protein translocase subunit SecD [Clostridiales bacterium]